MQPALQSVHPISNSRPIVNNRLLVDRASRFFFALAYRRLYKLFSTNRFESDGVLFVSLRLPRGVSRRGVYSHGRFLSVGALCVLLCVAHFVCCALKVWHNSVLRAFIFCVVCIAMMFGPSIYHYDLHHRVRVGSSTLCDLHCTFFVDGGWLSCGLCQTARIAGSWWLTKPFRAGPSVSGAHYLEIVWDGDSKSRDAKVVRRTPIRAVVPESPRVK